ncbi:hypothetical protein PInf_005070 [Phytophthora infestans]|nr:hypothetical protein PInf_005070 [Phytophthora infestans]
MSDTRKLWLTSNRLRTQQQAAADLVATLAVAADTVRAVAADSVRRRRRTRCDGDGGLVSSAGDGEGRLGAGADVGRGGAAGNGDGGLGDSAKVGRDDGVGGESGVLLLA